MQDLRPKVDELAELMEEFRLSQAELAGEGWRVSFRRRPSAPTAPIHAAEPVQMDDEAATAEPELPPAPAVPQGTPVNSPMTGIFYAASSPTSPPFAKEGDTVAAGQVVGLIEAMKVFNEITAPVSGTLLKVVAADGQIVNPGDPLMYIG